MHEIECSPTTNETLDKFTTGLIFVGHHGLLVRFIAFGLIPLTLHNPSSIIGLGLMQGFQQQFFLRISFGFLLVTRSFRSR